MFLNDERVANSDAKSMTFCCCNGKATKSKLLHQPTYLLRHEWYCRLVEIATEFCKKEFDMVDNFANEDVG